MAATETLEFGYNSSTGDRGSETMRPATFIADLLLIDEVLPTFY